MCEGLTPGGPGDPQTPGRLGLLGGKEQTGTGENSEEPRGRRGQGCEGGLHGAAPRSPLLLGPRELGEAGLSRVGAWEPACPGCEGAARGGGL